MPQWTALLLDHSRDAGAVKIALEVLSFCYCDGTEALLALIPAKVMLLASPGLKFVNLELCLANHVSDRGVVLSLLTTLRSLAAVSYHRLQNHPRVVDVSLSVSKVIVRVMLAHAGDEEVQYLGCNGLNILYYGCGFPQYPSQLNESSLQSAISAGAVVPVLQLHSALTTPTSGFSF